MNIDNADEVCIREIQLDRLVQKTLLYILCEDKRLKRIVVLSKKHHC
jgi:hypothetical protein